MLLQRIPLATAALALAALVLAYLIGRDVLFPPVTNTAGSVRTATVTRGSVRSVVTGTGSLVPLTSMNVGFKTAGTLTEVDVKVGDRVSSGQVLGKIDAGNLQVTADQAAASLATAQANLQNTLNGAALAQAQHALQSAQQTYADALNSVNLTNSQDQAQLSNDQQQLSVDNAQLSADQAGYWYTQYQPALQHWQQQYAADTATYQAHGCTAYGTEPATCTTSDQQAPAADQAHIACIQQGGGGACSAQEQQIALAYRAVSADQARVSADQSKISLDQARLSTDQQGGQSRLNGAQSAITSAQDSLNTQSTSRPATIATQQAAVESAQAALQTAQANLAAASLVAPMEGTVTAVNGSVGDGTTGSGTSTPATGTSGAGASSSGSASSGSGTFVTLSNLSVFQIATAIAEADASRVQVGQTATVTFDAVQGLSAPAHVTLVAPTATVTSNVVNYSVTFALDQTDPRLRAGMTSNVTVTVASASNVLVVPNSALTRVGTRAVFVTLLDRAGRQSRTAVATGVAGDTSTEISSGLQEGERVVLPQLRAGAAAGQAAGRGAGIPGGGGGGIRVG